MERQQVIAYQLDLFTEAGQDAICPYTDSEEVNRAKVSKASQVKEAGGQERALTPNLMEAVLCQSNITQAYKQVKRNKGVAGIDHMSISDFAKWYKTNGESLISQLLNGSYTPQGVRQVEIPKPNGGVRKLGIPTVTDRVIQQAIVYITPIVPHFSIEKYTTYQSLERM